MEDGLKKMSISEIKIVAFGNPNRNDNAFTIFSYSDSIGAQTRFITCNDNELFSTFNHGKIDWRESTNGIHWLVNSAETILLGDSPKSAVGAGMTFGELEGAKMVMIVDVPKNSEDISKSWGFVISRIRQIHVLFFTPRALDAISKLEQIPVADILKEIRNRGLVPHVCTYLSDEKKAMVEHSMGSVSVITEHSLQPLEWLARYICILPLSGTGNSGVKDACLGDFE
tara:strand:- start:10952 stop:11632 length:681 start_codon:yes stop_codon:yes gene_type:complete